MARRGALASGPRVLDFAPSAADDNIAVEVSEKPVPAGTVLHRGEAFLVLRHAWDVVTFIPFILVGLVPPFSPFFKATLEEFGLHMVHLTPNDILTLALFAHVCEAFMGVILLVALLRHFFILVRSPTVSPGAGAAPQHRTVGGVLFRRRGADFLPLVRRDKWENWER